jgi:ribosomal protein S20
VAKRTKSALKANRQNIKRREANRQMRSRLRTALKAIRASLDDNDLEGAKAALSKTVRYKSRLSSRLSKATA